MNEILIRAGSLVCIIVIAYLLKKRGIFSEQDRVFLSRILLTVNFPCVIITSFRNFTFEPTLLFALLLGLLSNLIGMFLGIWLSKGRPSPHRGLLIMTSAGYNIANFTIPFVTGFLSSTSLLCVLMFDVGNSLMALGTTYAIATTVLGGKRVNLFGTMARKLKTSPPFVTYVIMLLISSFGITFPAPIYIITELAASSTAYLAMILIGIMMDFSTKKQDRNLVCDALLLRYGLSVALSFVVYMLPFPLELRKGIMIALCSPVVTSSLVFSQELGCKPSPIGAVSTVGILTSLVLIVLIVMFL